MDTPEGDVAVAAAAVVALRLGAPLDNVNDYDRDEVDGLVVESQALHALTAVAVRALDRVMADDSAVRSLWDETPSAGDFRASVAAIRAALTERN